jgi:2-amino-4-hydroxy-6-hydroxymethyldihydropteridine diphosphokinase
MSHSVYIALGSNLGDRSGNLEAAVEALSPSVRVLLRSPIYETPPWGYTDQPDFLNQVIQAETELSPQDLLSDLKKIEEQLGRQPTIQYGPRKIDLDILFYDDLLLESPSLTIPHPQLAERAFVLLPLADLAPDLLHPVLGITIDELLSNVNQEGIHLYDKD